ncbi:tetratricopeptide repeat protein [Egbenema bharatensis]|uniref:tetratricopeptide repeat protein n=1 Tax=Egbenema bharatensis TaxID=3463334 RepID=UPI003A8764D0
MNTNRFTHRNSYSGSNPHPAQTALTKLANAVHPYKWQSKKRQSRENSLSGANAEPGSTRSEPTALVRQKALAEARQGNYALSIALFSHLIEREPGSANDYSNRGLVYFQDGQSEAALADYNRAIELNPQLDSAYNNRANYFAAQGQFLEAVLDYDVALDLNPTNIRAWINQGITFRELEMYERAIESFELALCLGRLEGHIYAERGRTYHLRGDWNCAVADYYRALTELPTVSVYASDPSVHLRLQVESWLDELMSPLR